MTELVSQKATINDVASQAGVSKKTVSRVINNESNVREETRARVQQVMTELNYYPNFSARSLASKRSYLVAMLYFDVGAFFLHELQSGLLERFESCNYSLLMQACQGDEQEVLKMVEHKARYMNIDGFVVVPPLSSMAPLTSLLKALGKPYIRITPCGEYEGDSDVICNDEQASFDLVNHFIAQGHKAIAFVRGLTSCQSTLVRFEGYCRALQSHGLTINEQWIVDGNYSFSSGVAAGQRLLSAESRPTAIFCSNDDMAAGVLHVAHDMNIRVPQDLAVAGFDDSPLAKHTWPAMTSVRQPNRRMAEIAADKLIDKIECKKDVIYPANLDCDISYRVSTEGWRPTSSHLTARIGALHADHELLKRMRHAVEA
jgi:LacI family transcriptional regulator